MEPTKKPEVKTTPSAKKPADKKEGSDVALVYSAIATTIIVGSDVLSTAYFRILLLMRYKKVKVCFYIGHVLKYFTPSPGRPVNSRPT